MFDFIQSKRKKILETGCLGFIDSHGVAELQNDRFVKHIFDYISDALTSFFAWNISENRFYNSNKSRVFHCNIR